MPFAMRNRMGCALAVAFAALIICARSATGQTPSSGALPDVLGIRPGMPIGEAYRLLKAHDPKALIEYLQYRIEAISEKPITQAFLYSAGSSQYPENISVEFTFPPGEQTVWRVARRIHFPPSEAPLSVTLLTGLRRKYGRDVPSPTPEYVFWVFDEQGRPAGSSSGINLTDCAGNVQDSAPIGQQGGTLNVTPGMRLNSTLINANRETCHPFVYVKAILRLDGPKRELVNGVTVTITALGAAIRTGTATEALINQAAAAQEQREHNKARQRPAPKF
jgi:hypothetical protein